MRIIKRYSEGAALTDKAADILNLERARLPAPHYVGLNLRAGVPGHYKTRTAHRATLSSLRITFFAPLMLHLLL